MRRGLAVAAAGAALAAMACQRSGTHERAASLVLDHANVIDVGEGKVLPDMRIRIAGRHVLDVNRSRGALDAGDSAARVVDLGGAYVIPGLWDMHVHIDTTERWFFPLAVLAGVTGVRDMGGSFERLARWRDLGSADSTLRPLVVASGPIVTGNVDDPDPRIVKVASSGEAAAAVDSVLGAGASFIKVHDWLTADAYRSLAERATQHGAHVAGHLPIAVDPAAAVAAQQRSIEHLGNGFGLLSMHAARTPAFVDSMRGWMRSITSPAGLAQRMTPAWYAAIADSFDTAGAQRLADQLRRGNVWVTPTLYFSYWLQLAALDSTLVTDERLGLLPSSVRAMLPYLAPPERFRALSDTAPTVRFYRLQQELARILRDGRVGLLAGTDVGPYAPMIPGFSLHDELYQLTLAGLTPLEALRAATINPARYFARADSLACIREGCRADLVVLDADPLSDIRNVTRIQAIIAGGRWIDRAERQRILQRLRDEFR